MKTTNNNHVHTGPYLSLRKAAEYCGYQPDTFRKLSAKYRIPKLGPSKTRYAQSDLDTFMNEPTTWVDYAEQPSKHDYVKANHAVRATRRRR